MKLNILIFIHIYLIVSQGIFGQNKRDLKFELANKDSEVIVIKVLNKKSALILSGINNFSIGKAELSSNQIQELKKFSNSLDENKVTELKIIGHTDIRGSEAYNKRLSLERAKAVEAKLKEFLKNKKINYKVEGKGKETPISNNHLKNRRVEIYLKTL